jgi:parallel beta-helix repeat protein
MRVVIVTAAMGAGIIATLALGINRPPVASGATTFTVDSTLDAADAVADGVCDDGAGHCTLRAAIMEADAGVGSYVVNFNVAGGGGQVVEPSVALPVITNPTTIDGSTQPSCSAACIELDGEFCGACAYGLETTASNTVIKALVINRFSGAGVVLAAPGGASTVSNSLIGTDPAGTIARPNGGPGVLVQGSSNNTIAQDTISGNAVGVRIEASSGAGTTNNLVQGGRIGTDQTGTFAVPNVGAGVEIDGTGTQPVSANRLSTSIAGNGGPGVFIHGAMASGNLIQLSEIGVVGIYYHPPGTPAPIPNGGDGIFITDGAHDNTVGCPLAGFPATCTNLVNTVAFNHGAGVAVGTWPSGNTILATLTHDNDGLGIDVAPFGSVTAPYDGALSSAEYCPAGCMGFASGLLSITGYLLGGPPDTQVLSIGYLNPICDPSGHGESATFIGQGFIHLPASAQLTDHDGNATGSAALAAGAIGPGLIGQFITSSGVLPDGSSSEMSNCIQVQSDSDGDGIEDAIDWSAGQSTSGNFSDDFDARQLGASVYGSIVDRASCYISVVPAGTASTYDPADGVVIGDICPNGVTGPATIALCGIGAIQLSDGQSVAENCHSLDTTVAAGPVTETFGAFSATLPTNTTSAVADLGGGRYRVTNDPSSSGPIVAGGHSVAVGQTITLPLATSSVGGIAEQPDVAALPVATTTSRDRTAAFALVGLGLLVAALGAGGWYVLRTRGA